jgi:(p)ppGpp synthase/HD superfamily hydrolase
MDWINTYAEALEFATLAHDGQRRKWGNLSPYIIHPIRVSKRIISLTGNLCLATAGLLHDTIEDTNITFDVLKEKFGSKIAELVESVTKRKDIQRKSEREDEYLQRFSMASVDTVVLKLADRMDNIVDSVNAPPQFRDGYIRNTIQLLDTIPKYTTTDQFVISLLKEITAWTINGYIAEPK